MTRTPDPLDPRGLIRESYRMDGISASECRSVFLDWALGFDSDTDAARQALLDRYGAEFPDHPMTSVLSEGLGASMSGPPPRRRGGWRSRARDTND